MCGRMVSSKRTSCPGCGERVNHDRQPHEVDPETAREVDFRVLTSLLGIIWIGWSLISGCASLTGFADAYGYLSPGPLVLMIYLSCALAWFVSGLAALRKEMWGVYLGYVFSYVMLLTSLFNVNSLGMLIALGFILLSRLVLKKHRQLTASGASSEDE